VTLGVVRGEVIFDMISKSPEETYQLGKIMGKRLKAGDIVALTGELGSGKTVLTQGIASGLGVPASYAVTSPTFTLINEYPGKKTALYHLDVYRLTGSADLVELGYEEYILGDGVTVIEWAEKIADAIPDEALFVSFSYLGENERRIEISGFKDMIVSLKRTLKEGGC
jgi:tRNA threonylcarbamoyladenosine biosynthesis protein TsaE